MRDIVTCRECKHRVPPMVPPMCLDGRNYCRKLKVYIYGDLNEGYCIHGERKGGTRTKTQIEWALYVLNYGAWRGDFDDDASDADMTPLYDAIDIVNDVLKRLTYCSECKFFGTPGGCERCSIRKLVLDSCSNGEAKEEEDEK